MSIDDLAVGQGLALGEPSRLVCDPLMGLESGPELGVQARPLVLRPRRRAVQARLDGTRQRQDLLSPLPPWRLGLAHQRHPHVAHPPALAADAAHPLLEVVLEWLRVRLQRRAPGGTLGGHGGDDLEDFWGR